MNRLSINIKAAHPKKTGLFFRTVALMLCVCLLATDLAQAAPIERRAASGKRETEATQGSQTPKKNRPLTIPAALGTVETSAQGASGKTIIYIQDAHDSLDAQVKIAKIIHYLVEHYGIKIVFEEGYEGPVPTDKYFSGIPDTRVKRKVAHALMDKLLIGGAEYAHITRFDKAKGKRGKGAAQGDFELIGADNVRLHLENIEWYRQAALTRESTDMDLQDLSARVQKLADQHLPKTVKKLMKLRKRFDAGELGLLEYLKRLIAMHSVRAISATAAVPLRANDYPNILAVLAAERAKTPESLRAIHAIRPRELFSEIEIFENRLADKLLTQERDREIFHYGKILNQLRRMNALEIPFEEYKAIQAALKTFKTQELLAFIVRQTRRSLAVSKKWETNIRRAMRFYELAEERDQAIETALKKYMFKDPVARQQVAVASSPSPLLRHSRPRLNHSRVNSSGNPDPRQNHAGMTKDDVAILIFGGFHKQNIETLLRRNNFSYCVITPRISKDEPRHKVLYRKLMAASIPGYQAPAAMRTATRYAPIFETAEFLGQHSHAKSLIAEEVRRVGSRSEIRQARRSGTIRDGTRRFRSEMPRGGSRETSVNSAEPRSEVGQAATAASPLGTNFARAEMRAEAAPFSGDVDEETYHGMFANDRERQLFEQAVSGSAPLKSYFRSLIPALLAVSFYFAAGGLAGVVVGPPFGALLGQWADALAWLGVAWIGLFGREFLQQKSVSRFRTQRANLVWPQLRVGQQVYYDPGWEEGARQATITNIDQHKKQVSLAWVSGDLTLESVGVSPAFIQPIPPARATAGQVEIAPLENSAGGFASLQPAIDTLKEILSDDPAKAEFSIKNQGHLLWFLSHSFSAAALSLDPSDARKPEAMLWRKNLFWIFTLKQIYQSWMNPKAKEERFQILAQYLVSQNLLDDKGRWNHRTLDALLYAPGIQKVRTDLLKQDSFQEEHFSQSLQDYKKIEGSYLRIYVLASAVIVGALFLALLALFFPAGLGPNVNPVFVAAFGFFILPPALLTAWHGAHFLMRSRKVEFKEKFQRISQERVRQLEVGQTVRLGSKVGSAYEQTLAEIVEIDRSKNILTLRRWRNNEIWEEKNVPAFRVEPVPAQEFIPPATRLDIDGFIIPPSFAQLKEFEKSEAFAKSAVEIVTFPMYQLLKKRFEDFVEARKRRSEPQDPFLPKVWLSDMRNWIAFLKIRNGLKELFEKNWRFMLRQWMRRGDRAPKETLFLFTQINQSLAPDRLAITMFENHSNGRAMPYLYEIKSEEELRFDDIKIKIREVSNVLPGHRLASYPHGWVDHQSRTLSLDAQALERQIQRWSANGRALKSWERFFIFRTDRQIAQLVNRAREAYGKNGFFEKCYAVLGQSFAMQILHVASLPPAATFHFFDKDPRRTKKAFVDLEDDLTWLDIFIHGETLLALIFMLQSEKNPSALIARLAGYEGEHKKQAADLWFKQFEKNPDQALKILEEHAPEVRRQLWDQWQQALRDFKPNEEFLDWSAMLPDLKTSLKREQLAALESWQIKAAAQYRFEGQRVLSQVRGGWITGLFFLLLVPVGLELLKIMGAAGPAVGLLVAVFLAGAVAAWAFITLMVGLAALVSAQERVRALSSKWAFGLIFKNEQPNEFLPAARLESTIEASRLLQLLALFLSAVPALYFAKNLNNPFAPLLWINGIVLVSVLAFNALYNSLGSPADSRDSDGDHLKRLHYAQKISNFLTKGEILENLIEWGGFKPAYWGNEVIAGVLQDNAKSADPISYFTLARETNGLAVYRVQHEEAWQFMRGANPGKAETFLYEVVGVLKDTPIPYRVTGKRIHESSVEFEEMHYGIYKLDMPADLLARLERLFDDSGTKENLARSETREQKEAKHFRQELKLLKFNIFLQSLQYGFSKFQRHVNRFLLSKLLIGVVIILAGAWAARFGGVNAPAANILGWATALTAFAAFMIWVADWLFGKKILAEEKILQLLRDKRQALNGEILKRLELPSDFRLTEQHFEALFARLKPAISETERAAFESALSELLLYLKKFQQRTSEQRVISKRNQKKLDEQQEEILLNALDTLNKNLETSLEGIGALQKNFDELGVVLMEINRDSSNAEFLALRSEMRSEGVEDNPEDFARFSESLGVVSGRAAAARLVLEDAQNLSGFQAAPLILLTDTEELRQKKPIAALPVNAAGVKFNGVERLWHVLGRVIVREIPAMRKNKGLKRISAKGRIQVLKWRELPVINAAGLPFILDKQKESTIYLLVALNPDEEPLEWGPPYFSQAKRHFRSGAWYYPMKQIWIISIVTALGIMSETWRLPALLLLFGFGVIKAVSIWQWVEELFDWSSSLLQIKRTLGRMQEDKKTAGVADYLTAPQPALEGRVVEVRRLSDERYLEHGSGSHTVFFSHLVTSKLFMVILREQGKILLNADQPLQVENDALKLSLYLGGLLVRSYHEPDALAEPEEPANNYREMAAAWGEQFDEDTLRALAETRTLYLEMLRKKPAGLKARLLRWWSGQRSVEKEWGWLLDPAGSPLEERVTRSEMRMLTPARVQKINAWFEDRHDLFKEMVRLESGVGALHRGVPRVEDERRIVPVIYDPAQETSLSEALNFIEPVVESAVKPEMQDRAKIRWRQLRYRLERPKSFRRVRALERRLLKASGQIMWDDIQAYVRHALSVQRRTAVSDPMQLPGFPGLNFFPKIYNVVGSQLSLQIITYDADTSHIHAVDINAFDIYHGKPRGKWSAGDSVEEMRQAQKLQDLLEERSLTEGIPWVIEDSVRRTSVRSLSVEARQAIFKTIESIHRDSGQNLQSLTRDLKFEFEREFPSNDTLFMVSRGGAVAGYALVSEQRERQSATLYALHVRQAWAKQGVDELLLDQILKFLTRRGVQSLTAFVLLENQGLLKATDRLIESGRLSLSRAALEAFIGTHEVRVSKTDEKTSHELLTHAQQTHGDISGWDQAPEASVRAAWKLIPRDDARSEMRNAAKTPVLQQELEKRIAYSGAGELDRFMVQWTVLQNDLIQAGYQDVDALLLHFAQQLGRPLWKARMTLTGYRADKRSEASAFKLLEEFRKIMLVEKRLPQKLDWAGVAWDPVSLDDLAPERFGEAPELADWISLHPEPVKSLLWESARDELIRLGFPPLKFGKPDELIKQGEEAVTLAIIHPANHNDIVKIREGAKHANTNVLLVLPENVQTGLSGDGREVFGANAAIVFKEDQPYWVTFETPLPIHYLMNAEEKFQERFRTHGIPTAMDPTKADYFNDKALTEEILMQQEISTPASGVILRPRSGRAAGLSQYRQSRFSWDRRFELETFLRDFMSEHQLSEIVLKPVDGSQGYGITFFNRLDFEPAYQKLKELKLKRILSGLRSRDMLIQGRVTPELMLHTPDPDPEQPDVAAEPLVLDWNLRVLVSLDEQGRPVVSGIVVRAGYEETAVNISQGSMVMLLEEVAEKLKMSADELETLRQSIADIARRTFDALQSRAQRDGVLKPGENTSDFLGLDLMVAREDGKLVPYVIEVNGSNSGGLWALDSLLAGKYEKDEGQRREQQGSAIRDWIRLAARRALLYKESLREKSIQFSQATLPFNRREYVHAFLMDTDSRAHYGMGRLQWGARALIWLAQIAALLELWMFKDKTIFLVPSLIYFLSGGLLVFGLLYYARTHVWDTFRFVAWFWLHIFSITRSNRIYDAIQRLSAERRAAQHAKFPTVSEVPQRPETAGQDVRTTPTRSEMRTGFYDADDMRLDPKTVAEKYLPALEDVPYFQTLMLLHREGYGFSAERHLPFSSIRDAVAHSTDYFALIPNLLYAAFKLKAYRAGMDPQSVDWNWRYDWQHRRATFPEAFESKVASPVLQRAAQPLAVAPGLPTEWDMKDFEKLGLHDWNRGSQAEVKQLGHWSVLVKIFKDDPDSGARAEVTDASHRLAMQKLGGLVPDFTFIRMKHDTQITFPAGRTQDLTVHYPHAMSVHMLEEGNLKEQILKAVEHGGSRKAEELLRDQLQLVLKIIRRGAIPHDAHFDNFGTLFGFSLLLDLGGVHEKGQAGARDAWILLNLASSLHANQEWLRTSVGSEALARIYEEEALQLGLWERETLAETIEKNYGQDPAVPAFDIAGDLEASIRDGLSRLPSAESRSEMRLFLNDAKSQSVLNKLEAMEQVLADKNADDFWRLAGQMDRQHVTWAVVGDASALEGWQGKRPEVLGRLDRKAVLAHFLGAISIPPLARKRATHTFEAHMLDIPEGGINILIARKIRQKGQSYLHVSRAASGGTLAKSLFYYMIYGYMNSVAMTSQFNAIVPLQNARKNQKDVVETLRGGSYSSVQRLTNPDGTSLIVKRANTQKDKGKLRSEAEYMRALQAAHGPAGAYFPTVYSITTEGPDTVVVMEDVFWPSLSDIFQATNLPAQAGLLPAALSPKNRFEISRQIYRTLTPVFYAQRQSETPPDFLERFHFQKTEERWTEARALSPLLNQLFEAPYLEIQPSGGLVKNLPNLKTALNVLRHVSRLYPDLFTPPYLSRQAGDLHFGNILMDPFVVLAGGNTDSFRLVDPKWIPEGNDPLYDFAKLMHNYSGHYDLALNLSGGYHFAIRLPESTGAPAQLRETFIEQHSSAERMMHAVRAYEADVRKFLREPDPSLFSFEEPNEFWKYRLLFTHATLIAGLLPYHASGDAHEQRAGILYERAAELFYELIKKLWQDGWMDDDHELKNKVAGLWMTSFGDRAGYLQKINDLDSHLGTVLRSEMPRGGSRETSVNSAELRSEVGQAATAASRLGTRSARAEMRSSGAISGLEQRKKEITMLQTQYQAEGRLANRAQFLRQTDDFKQHLREDGSLDEILPEAFAVFKEAARTVLGLDATPEQIMAALAIHTGHAIEMEPSEGKTLSIAMAAYLHALTGRGVHIHTFNDSLAARDTQDMAKVLHFLGLSVGVRLDNKQSLLFDPKAYAMREPWRKHLKNAARPQEVYLADITYGVKDAFAFDYLADQTIGELKGMRQRPEAPALVVVDEGDSTFLDEAHYPLILTEEGLNTQLELSPEEYIKIYQTALALEQGTHYKLNFVNQAVTLNPSAMPMAMQLLSRAEFAAERLRNFQEAGEIENLLKQAAAVKHWNHRDQDYVLQNGQIVLIDELTGRLKEQHVLGNHRHQLVAAKESFNGERAAFPPLSLITGILTYQNYYRKIKRESKLAMITGTMGNDAPEVKEIYGLDYVRIPNHYESRLTVHEPVMHVNREEKFAAILAKIEEIHARGNPVLVFVSHIDEARRFKQKLEEATADGTSPIQATLVDGLNLGEEAEAIAQAGQHAQVTIATNVVGRGVNIKIDEAVAALGGLAVILTESQQARRIDDQLIRRGARQGQPGEVYFFYAKDDPVMARFGGQAKSEAYLRETRAQTLAFDDVLEPYRAYFYTARRQLLTELNPKSKTHRLRQLMAVDRPWFDYLNQLEFMKYRTDADSFSQNAHTRFQAVETTLEQVFKAVGIGGKYVPFKKEAAAFPRAEIVQPDEPPPGPETDSLTEQAKRLQAWMFLNRSDQDTSGTMRSEMRQPRRAGTIRASAEPRSEMRESSETLAKKDIRDLSVPAAVFLDAGELARMQPDEAEQRAGELLALLNQHRNFDIYLEGTERIPVSAIRAPQFQKLLEEYPDRVHQGLFDRAHLAEKRIVIQASLFESASTVLQTQEQLKRLKQSYQVKGEVLALEYTKPGALKAFLALAELGTAAELVRKISDFYAVLGANGRWQVAETYLANVWSDLVASTSVAWSA